MKMSFDLARKAAIGSIAVLALMQGHLASAAVTKTAPYDKGNTVTNKIDDVLGFGSTTVSASSTPSTGVLAISASSTENAPAGAIVSVPYGPHVGGFGATSGYASAGFTQSIPVTAAGTYTVALQFDSISATTTTNSSPSPAPYVYPSYATAYTNAYAYLYCYYSGTYKAAGIYPVDLKGKTSLTLTGNISCGAAGDIRISVGVAGVTQAQGQASASFNTTATLSSISVTP